MGRVVAALLLLSATALAVFELSNVAYGACYDSATDPAASYCTTGSLLGATGSVILWGLWGLLVVLCAVWAWRGVRAGRRNR